MHKDHYVKTHLDQHKANTVAAVHAAGSDQRARMHAVASTLKAHIDEMLADPSATPEALGAALQVAGEHADELVALVKGA